jgi:hypothetical protein
LKSACRHVRRHRRSMGPGKRRGDGEERGSGRERDRQLGVEEKGGGRAGARATCFYCPLSFIPFTIHSAIYSSIHFQLIVQAVLWHVKAIRHKIRTLQLSSDPLLPFTLYGASFLARMPGPARNLSGSTGHCKTRVAARLLRVTLTLGLGLVEAVRVRIWRGASQFDPSIDPRIGA